jgi:hypothetical protein
LNLSNISLHASSKSFAEKFHYWQYIPSYCFRSWCKLQSWIEHSQLLPNRLELRVLQRPQSCQIGRNWDRISERTHQEYSF